MDTTEMIGLAMAEIIDEQQLAEQPLVDWVDNNDTSDMRLLLRGGARS